MKKFFFIALLVLISWTKTFAADVADRNPFVKPQQLSEKMQSNMDGSISMNFVDVKVRDVLQMLAEYAGKNIVISDSVQGNLTFLLNHVTWQQALETVLIMKNLIKKEQGNVIYILTNNEINSNRLTMSSSELIKIHYANASDLAALLKSQESGLLSKQGYVSADPRTNTLWVQDSPQHLALIRNFIQRLDVSVKQVLIKARIVNMDENCLKELGVKFGTVPSSNPLSLDGLAMDMPIAINHTGKFNIAIAKLGANTLLDLELSALESEGHAKIISSPELITADRTPAHIEAGEEVPYQERTPSGATSVAFKKAVLSLKVTPHVTPKGDILLNLTVNQDKLSAITVHGVPAIQTREIQTQVTVQNAQTIVLGGIYEQSDSRTVERIPFLGSLPVVGGLFRTQSTNSERKELLIFVTPKIVD
jgi:type IV pilus assembly protein PilQ